MAAAWLAEQRNAIAADRLLDAAGEVFAVDGPSAVTMADIATAAGCSRATLYNHFPDRRALEIAFVHREALEVAATAARRNRHRDPHDRAVQTFLDVLHAVRSDRRLIAWFRPTDVAVATAISADSSVIEALGTAFVSDLEESSEDPGSARRGRWLVRCMVSLLSMPEDSPEEERRVLEEFVVPSLLGKGHGDPRSSA